MGRKTSEPTRYMARQAAIDAALQLDSQCDVYRDETDAGLTAQQWQAIALLVAGRKQVEVAQEIGVTQETVSRWRSGPLFAAALNAAIRDNYQAIVGDVRSVASEAVTVLRESMQVDDARVRLSAALAALRLYTQLDAGATSLSVTPADIARDEKQRTQHNLLRDMY